MLNKFKTEFIEVNNEAKTVDGVTYRRRTFYSPTLKAGFHVAEEKFDADNNMIWVLDMYPIKSVGWDFDRKCFIELKKWPPVGCEYGFESYTAQMCIDKALAEYELFTVVFDKPPTVQELIKPNPDVPTQIYLAKPNNDNGVITFGKVGEQRTLQLKELEELVGGYIIAAPQNILTPGLGKGIQVFLVEDGEALGLAPTLNSYDVPPLLGPIIFCRKKGEDLIGLSDVDLTRVKYWAQANAYKG